MPRKPKSPEPPPRRTRASGSVSFDVARQQWRARTPRDQHGRRQSAYFATRPEAEAWLADWIARAKQAASPFDPARPFGELCRYWYRLNVGRWKPNQRRKVRSQINVCRPIAHHPSDRLRADHLDELLAILSAKNLEPLYVRNIGRLVQRVLEWAVRRKILAENATAEVDLPSARRKPPRAWTIAETATFTAACAGHRFEAAFLLMVHAGLRIGEVLALRWEHVDTDAGVVSVQDAEYTAANREIGTPKYDSDGGVDVASPIMARLKALKDAAESPYVLGKPTTPGWRDRYRRADGHERWCDTTARRDWYALCTAAGVRVLPPHSGGRHSFATGHMVAGTDLADLADLMRHKTPAITAQTYLSGNRKRRREAAERLGRLISEAPGENGAPVGTLEAC